jgi:hypothetical protein
MSSLTMRIASAAGTVVLALVFAPSAVAAKPVFGGSTGDREPIVLTADRAAKKLKSVVVAAEAKCSDGLYFPITGRAIARKATAGFAGGPQDLMMTRNARGRFAGTAGYGAESDQEAALVTASVNGKLKARVATGTLRADVTIMDKQSNAQVADCHTGKVKWAAARAPGHVYGGRSSQDEPVVVRLDAKRKKVNDILAGWESASCTPDGFMRFGDRMTNFPLHANEFGDSWTEPFDMPDGTKRTVAYEVAGRVAQRSIKGTLHVGVTDTDAAGATRASCDTGTVTWNVATG